MLGRRELFRRAMGAGVAVATVKPSDLIAASKGVSGLGAVAGNIPQTGETVTPDTCVNSAWQLLDDVQAQRGFANSDVRYMDTDIRDKKSWSPAFKSIVHSERERELHNIRRMMQNDEKFANKVMHLLRGAK